MLLEGLPKEVLDKVCELLSYQDLIRLKQVSRHFKAAVDPVRQCRDIFGMWKFLREMTIAKWWGGEGFGQPRMCFGCFRPRTVEQFSSKQYSRPRAAQGQGYWRRRCWECVQRFHHPQLPDVDARDRFYRQKWCHRCQSLRFVDEDCLGCESRTPAVLAAERLAWVRKEERALGFWDRVADEPFEWLEDGQAIEILGEWFNEFSGFSTQSGNNDLWDDTCGDALYQWLGGYSRLDTESRDDDSSDNRELLHQWLEGSDLHEWLHGYAEFDTEPGDDDPCEKSETLRQWLTGYPANSSPRTNYDFWDGDDGHFHWLEGAANSQLRDDDIQNGLLETIFSSLKLWDEENLDTTSESAALAAGTTAEEILGTTNLLDIWGTEPEEGRATLIALGQGSGVQGEVLAH
ncbi:hypothetical protein N0V88_007715 [Collariella sp. IMI 366227]|nr:hypothetical protein N0V88_007715 [Collariella sp. IMI 366227]